MTEIAPLVCVTLVTMLPEPLDVVTVGNVWCDVKYPASFVNALTFVGTVGIDGLFDKSLYEPLVATVAKPLTFAAGNLFVDVILSCLPEISWCAVKNPESLVQSLVFVGIVGLFVKSS